MNDAVDCPVCGYGIDLPDAVAVEFDRSYTVHREPCAAYLSDVELKLLQLNEEYALLDDGGRYRIVRWKDGTVMSVSVFQGLEISNRRVTILRNGRLREDFPLSQLWLEWSGRGVISGRTPLGILHLRVLRAIARGILHDRRRAVEVIAKARGRVKFWTKRDALTGRFHG